MRASFLLLTASVALGGAFAGCTASSEEVRPPDDELFFPTGLAISPEPDPGNLFVISANSDLRYDSGTILVVDLAAVDQALDGWLGSDAVPGGCRQDPELLHTVDCPVADYLVADAGVRIGNFATSLGVQDMGGGDLRLVVPVRGDPSVTWIDFDGASRELTCSDDAGFQLCDDDHRLTRFRDDEDLDQITTEPYGIFVDSTNEYALVTHLTSSTVSLIDLAGTPILTDKVTGIFAADANNRRGSVGVAGRQPGTEDDLIYVSSLSESRIQTFSVARLADDMPALVPADFFFLDRIATNAGGSSDTRAVAFGSNGDRGYFVNRDPPSLAVVDTSLDTTGAPRNEAIGATDVCRDAIGVSVADLGDGDRVFVACHTPGLIYVIDPRPPVRVESIQQVGRGPFGMAVSPSRNRLYVTNFFENTIAVVDLTPGAATQYHVVLRLENPS